MFLPTAQMYSQSSSPDEFVADNHSAHFRNHNRKNNNISNSRLVIEDYQIWYDDCTDFNTKSSSRKRQRRCTNPSSMMPEARVPTPPVRFSKFTAVSKGLYLVDHICVLDEYLNPHGLRPVAAAETSTRSQFINNQYYVSSTVNQEIPASSETIESNERHQILDTNPCSGLQHSRWKLKESSKVTCDNCWIRCITIRLLTMLTASVAAIYANAQPMKTNRINQLERSSYNSHTLDTSYDNFVNNSLLSPIQQWHQRLESVDYHHNLSLENVSARSTLSRRRFLSSYSNSSYSTSAKYSSSSGSNSSSSTGRSNATSASIYSSSYNSSSSTSTNKKYSYSYNTTVANSTSSTTSSSTNSKYSSSYNNSSSNSSGTTSSGSKSSSSSAYSSGNSSSSSSTSGKYSSGYSNSTTSSTSTNGKYSTTYGSYNSSTSNSTNGTSTGTSSSKYASGYSSTSGEVTDTNTSNSNNSIAVSQTIDPNKGLQQINSFCKRNLIRVVSLRLLCNSPGAYYAGSNAYRKSDVCQAGDKAILEVEFEISERMMYQEIYYRVELGYYDRFRVLNNTALCALPLELIWANPLFPVKHSEETMSPTISPTAQYSDDNVAVIDKNCLNVTGRYRLNTNYTVPNLRDNSFHYTPDVRITFTDARARIVGCSVTGPFTLHVDSDKRSKQGWIALGFACVLFVSVFTGLVMRSIRNDRERLENNGNKDQRKKAVVAQRKLDDTNRYQYFRTLPNGQVVQLPGMHPIAHPSQQHPYYKSPLPVLTVTRRHTKGAATASVLLHGEQQSLQVDPNNNNLSSVPDYLKNIPNVSSDDDDDESEDLSHGVGSRDVVCNPQYNETQLPTRPVI